MTKPTFLALIPARGGSKGIFKKNIKKVGGKPLILWTIEAAKHSKYISEIIVSSDDEDILSFAEGAGVIPLIRPSELALDDTPTEPVIKHMYESVASNQQYDFIILLQPTSPARNEKHIDEAIEILLERKASSLISVYEPQHSPLKSFILNNEGYMKGILDNKMPFMRRQDLPKSFMSNGAIYIIDVNEFIKKNSLLTERCIPFLMSEIDSIDIDTLEDIAQFESIVVGVNNA